jgi:hypothetical protein
MKSILNILLFTLLLSTSAAFSQSIGRNYRDRNYGGETTRKSSEKKYDFVEEALKFYTKELNLDDFQQAAVRTVLEEQRDPINQLMAAKGITTDERRDRGKAINDRIGEKMKPLLTEDQFKKYTVLQEKKKP